MIELPPELPPVQLEQMLGADKAEYQSVVDNVSVMVHANGALEVMEVDAIVRDSKTPSQAIRALSRTLRDQGKVAVSVEYVKVQDVVHVYLVPNTIARVDAEPAMQKYFAGLVGDTDLTEAELRKQALLAGIHASRLNESYVMRLSVEEDGATLHVDGEKGASDKTSFSAFASNEGSRYIGRYFGGFGASHVFDNGLQAVVTASAAVPRWGETSSEGDLSQLGFSISAPTAHALYSAELAYLKYDRSDVIQVSETTFKHGLPPLIPHRYTTTITDTPVQMDGELMSLRGLVDAPIYAGSTFSAAGHAMLGYEQYNIDITGADDVDERVALIELGSTGRYHDTVLGRAVLAEVKVGVQQGYGVKGGSFETELDGTDDAFGRHSGDFTRGLIEGGFDVNLIGGLNLKHKLVGRYTDDQALPLNLEFVLGGADSLAAYLPGVAAADTGYVQSLGLEYGLKLGQVKLDLSLFAEEGMVRHSATDTEEKPYLSDGGIKIALSAGQFSTSVVAAKPIYSRDIDEAEAEAMEVDFYWNLQYTF